jgi:hypothetical protein
VTRLLTTSAILLALASPAVAGMSCVLKDTQNNTLEWVFTDKSLTTTQTGFSYGEVYEIGFARNRNNTFPAAGQEPTWKLEFTPKVSLVIYSRAPADHVASYPAAAK